MSGSLNHSPAEIMRALLVDLGSGSNPGTTLPGWSIFDSKEPDEPDNCITIYDTAGVIDARAMTDGSYVEHHGLQLRIRGNDRQDAYEKARDLAVTLDKTVYDEPVVVDSSTYIVYAVSRKTDAISLGAESPTSRRFVFTINAVVALRQIS